MFLTEIQQQNQLPVLKQYLKLYTSISASKLADLMGSEPDQLLTLLMCLKHKTYSKTHLGSGSATEGLWSSSGDTDFIVDVDSEKGDEETVQIGDIKMQKNYMEYYSNHIQKLKGICSQLNAPVRAQGGW